MAIHLSVLALGGVGALALGGTAAALAWAFVYGAAQLLDWGVDALARAADRRAAQAASASPSAAFRAGSQAAPAPTSFATSQTTPHAASAASQLALTLAAARLLAGMALVGAAVVWLAPQWGWAALAAPLGWGAQRFAALGQALHPGAPPAAKAIPVAALDSSPGPSPSVERASHGV